VPVSKNTNKAAEQRKKMLSDKENAPRLVVSPAVNYIFFFVFVFLANLLKYPLILFGLFLVQIS
jgi:hypothetical protein